MTRIAQGYAGRELSKHHVDVTLGTLACCCHTSNRRRASPLAGPPRAVECGSHRCLPGGAGSESRGRRRGEESHTRRVACVEANIYIYIWRILDRWRWSRGQGRPGGGGRGADDVGVCELRCRLQDCGPGTWGDEKGRMGKEDGAWEQAMGEAWQPPANPSSLVELQGTSPFFLVELHGTHTHSSL